MISLYILLYFLCSSCGSEHTSFLSQNERHSHFLPQTGIVQLDTLQKLLDPFIRAPQKPPFVLKAYHHHLPSSIMSTAYIGGVFDPINSEIIFIPFRQAAQPTWHKYNCLLKKVVSYTHGVTATSGAYRGGTFDPVNQQIIFSPYLQTGNWHRYDCLSQTVIPYPGSPTLVESAYFGGVFDPIHNKIIFIPHTKSAETEKHRYNCITQSIEVYTTSTTSVRYIGGVLDPINHKIIFIPHTQSNVDTWHRYPVSTLSDLAYFGGAFDPIHQQIIFAPYSQVTSDWHRYDCLSQTFISYPQPHVPMPPATGAYAGAIFESRTLKIFFSPLRQGVLRDYLHYYDCIEGRSYTYANPFLDASESPQKIVPVPYYSGIFDPINNQIIFIPYGQSASDYWHSVQIISNTPTPYSIASHFLFNKF